MEKIKIPRDTSNRRKLITDLIRNDGSVQVNSLSDRFGVSLQTIRKDLQYLEHKGVAARAYGGAIAAEIVSISSEASVDQKNTLNVEIKAQLGKFAASLVKPGDSLVLDSGTTTLQIARHLPSDEEISVLTNDFNILSILAQKESLHVISLGGELRRKNKAFYGSQTLTSLEELLPEKLFLGVDGFDIERGITTHYEPEAQLNRKMVEVAREVIAVCDSSKFSRVCLHRIAGISELDRLITDKNAPREVLDACERSGVIVDII